MDRMGSDAEVLFTAADRLRLAMVGFITLGENGVVGTALRVVNDAESLVVAVEAAETILWLPNPAKAAFALVLISFNLA